MIMIPVEMGNSPESPTRFIPGQLVRHRRYGYRGVIVGFDVSCEAPDEWYLANQTQPRRDQPWYHVLVDSFSHTTYAAEDSLVEDDSGEQISHPLIDHFFEGFQDGHYVRNDRKWRMP